MPVAFTFVLKAVNWWMLSFVSCRLTSSLIRGSSIESGPEGSGEGLESTEFDIASGYASSGKVPPQEICYEAKWEHYVAQLSCLNLNPQWFGRFLSKVCSPPCSPSLESVEGWRRILPCLQTAPDWDLPIACWNETERALRRPGRYQRAMLRGLQALARECPERVGGWLRLSPHNFCRLASRLGQFSAEKIAAILQNAETHPLWRELRPPYKLQALLKRWGPMRPPDWVAERISKPMTEAEQEAFVDEFRKRQPTMQLDLLYRLLRS